MPYAGLIVLALLVFFFSVRWFVRAEPHQVARVLKKLFLLLVLCGVLVLVFTGKIVPVISIFIALLPLLIPIIIKARRNAQAGGSSNTSRSSNKMTRVEAYEILDLRSGASRSEIIAAHRRLMLKIHPDQGGSTYLAIKLNQAKDLLLGKR